MTEVIFLHLMQVSARQHFTFWLDRLNNGSYTLILPLLQPMGVIHMGQPRFRIETESPQLFVIGQHVIQLISSVFGVLLIDNFQLFSHFFHRHSQRASEDKEHRLCGHAGVDKVWTSGSRLEESLHRLQPRWSLSGKQLVATSSSLWRLLREEEQQ